MPNLPTEEKRNRVLLALYQLHNTASPHVNVSELKEFADVGDDFYNILKYLGVNGKRWLVKTNLRVNITTSGIDRAEELVKMGMAETMQSVLRKIYDMSGPDHNKDVNYFELQRELKMGGRDLNPILKDFEDKGWLGGGSDEVVRLIPRGVLEIENPKLENRSRDIYQTNIYGSNYGGVQQGGQGNTQNITLTNNADFDRALASIIELIRASNLPADDKEELEGEVTSVKKLALREPAPGLLDRAKSRLDLVRMGLQGADLLIKASPHIDAAWEFLRHKFGGN
jgi:hypothetical protein